MPKEPTADQVASREQVKNFLSKVQNLSKEVRSKWFSRPDDELKGWIERGQAIEDIKDSLGYKLILNQTDREIRWAQEQLEVCGEKAIVELRMYLRALRFFHDFILTTEKNCDIAHSVLAGREAEIDRDSQVFVKSVTGVRG